MSGGTVNTSAVIASSTVLLARSAPSATALSTSRSVMIPVRRPSSVMSSDPVCWRHMRSAADRRVSDAVSVTMASVMTSRTCTALCSSIVLRRRRAHPMTGPDRPARRPTRSAGRPVRLGRALVGQQPASAPIAQWIERLPPKQ